VLAAGFTGSTAIEGHLHAMSGAQMVHAFVLRSPRERVWAMGDIIRKRKNGKVLGWYIRWIEKGKRRQKASKQPTYALAKRMLLEIEARVARGMAGIIEPVPGSELTVAELCKKFVAEFSNPRLKDLDKYREKYGYVLRRILPY